ncbi:MAG: recombinase family protein [Anaerotardibacter sp.]
MTRYGYARVSSKDQNIARQISALKNEGITEEHLFVDKTSGKDFYRPGYLQLLDQLKPNDVVVVMSLDRFGRDYTEIQDQWIYLTRTKQVDIVVLDMPLLNTEKEQESLTKTFISDMVLSVISYVAQLEREKIRERQAQGIQLALQTGTRFGRPSKKPHNWDQFAAEIRSGTITQVQAAHMIGVHNSTVSRWFSKKK